jgi:hypothetical protein
MSPTKTKTLKTTTKKLTKPDADPELLADVTSVAASKFVIGDDVVHPQFGDGDVTDIEGDKLTITFADGRVKKIVDYYVRGRKK